MLWRVVRRLLAVGIRALSWRPVVSFTIVTIALGLAGFAIGGINNPVIIQDRVSAAAAPAPIVGGTPAPPVRSAPPTAPPPAVDEYIKGMASFDAHTMWKTLDQQAVQEMQSQGISEQALQQRLDGFKQQGASYDGVVFVGGYPLHNGDRYLFYVVSRRGFAGPGVTDQVYFVFTVGPNGKILRIQ